MRAAQRKVKELLARIEKTHLTDERGANLEGVSAGVRGGAA
jgi:hypothetical protein